MRRTQPTPRTYANFCSIAHTPFDFTLTFCEVMPLSEKEIKEAESRPRRPRAGARQDRRAGAVRARTSSRALQEHWRVFSESYNNVGWNKGAGPDSLTTDGAPREDATRHAGSSTRSRRSIPGADTELHYTQRVRAARRRRSCRRSRPTSGVNLVTPALFARYPDAPRAGRGDARGARAADSRDRLLPRRSRKALIGMARALVEHARRRRCRPTWTR